MALRDRLGVSNASLGAPEVRTVDDREQRPGNLHHWHNHCRWEQAQRLRNKEGIFDDEIRQTLAARCQIRKLHGVPSVCLRKTVQTQQVQLTMFRRVTQKAAAVTKEIRLTHVNQEPSWLLPWMVVRSSSDSALLNSTLCVPSSAAEENSYYCLRLLFWEANLRQGVGMQDDRMGAEVKYLQRPSS